MLHVHTHITPRYPDEIFVSAPTLSPEQLSEQITELRRHPPGGGI
ncbi:MAG: hypothetical protein ACRDN0_03800 [Trebonia sp.]